MKFSQYLVFLSVADESALIELIDKFNENGLRVSIFREPDIDNQITAIAVEPSVLTRKLTSNLPLMLKELKNTAPVVRKCTCEKCTGLKVESYYEDRKEKVA